MNRIIASFYQENNNYSYVLYNVAIEKKYIKTISFVFVKKIVLFGGLFRQLRKK